MRNQKKSIINLMRLSIIFFFISSCFQNNSDGRFKIVKKGEFRVEGKYLNDSIPVDTTKYFRLNGELDHLLIYNHSGKLSGEARYFYPDGKLKMILGYQNGTLQGRKLSFYPNGNLEAKQMTFRGVFVGDAYFFYESGGIKEYNFLNFTGDLLSFIKYDKNGNEIERQLSCFSTELVDTRIGNKFGALVILAHPPGFRNSGNLQFLFPSDTVLFSDTLNSELPINFVELPALNEFKSIRVITDQYDSIHNHNSTNIDLIKVENKE